MGNIKPRSNISPKLRFEVFKRDNFTCRYCGRKTPQVVLEIDHVVPVAEGGEDSLDNLVTSCWECNRGKGRTLIDALAPDVDIHEQTVLLLERELQIREYNAVRKAQRAREDEEIRELLAYWEELAGGGARKYPAKPTLRHWLRVVSVDEIKDAMEIAMARKGDWVGCAYLTGILKNWAKQRGLIGPEEEE